jgi:hypothetical protein
MTQEKIIQELQKIAAKAPRDDFHGMTLRALRRRGLIYRYWNGTKDYLTPRGRRLLNDRHTQS